ncbi:MAG: hypothetical protein RIT04_44 [Candidatus Parcubacteria bacterium]|jgi:ubiquinone/menaquinone biosynthesis C-methylase UbiE
MTNSHYPESLLKDYAVLLDHFPSHVTCRPYIVEVIEKWKQQYSTKHNPNGQIRILEIGPGYGETTELILENIPSTVTLVEADRVALDMLSSKLEKFQKQIIPINEDATSWIKSQPSNTYDVFTASWVIHNFPQDQREQFLFEVARILRSGGLFVIFDKILPDNQAEVERLWGIHTERLNGLDTIGKSEQKNEMLAHEIRDSKQPYVWHEREFKDSLRKLDFKDITIVMRNERDIVASGIK